MPRRGQEYYEIVDLLKQHGAVLERTKKHHVYRFPDGRIWVVAGTPHSSQGHVNNLHDLKGFLGLRNGHREGERREKRIKAKPAPKPFLASLPMVASKPKLSIPFVLRIATSNRHGQFQIERFHRTPFSVVLHKLCEVLGLRWFSTPQP